MKITNLKPGDILLGYIGIGNMPPARAKAYLGEVKLSLRETFKNPVVLIASYDRKGLELEVIRAT
jgi:hypothetical protein